MCDTCLFHTMLCWLLVYCCLCQQAPGRSFSSVAAFPLVCVCALQTFNEHLLTSQEILRSLMLSRRFTFSITFCRLSADISIAAKDHLLYGQPSNAQVTIKLYVDVSINCANTSPGRITCGFTAVLLSCSSELPGHTQRTVYIFDDIRLFSAIIAAWRQLEVESRVDKVLTTQTEQTVKC